MRRSIMTGVGAGLLALVLCIPATATAANGKVAFTRTACTGPFPPSCKSGIWAVDPSGASLTPLTSMTSARHPAWSPNGQRLAYTNGTAIFTIREDGSDGQHVLDWTPGVGHLSWSPDGSRLAASMRACTPDGCSWDVYTMRTDGTEVASITPGPYDSLNPAWSPDGSRIAFDSPQSGARVIWTIAPAGTGLTQVTHRASGADILPAWSPAGDEIAFESDRDGGSQLFTMKPDGTEIQNVTLGGQSSDPTYSPDGDQIAFRGQGIHRMPSTGGSAVAVTTNSFDSEPDWQFTARPGPITGHYPRPKSATPVQTSLVPAFRACETPNRVHGPPLAEPSCSPPAQGSPELTIGTADANGRPTRGMGSVRLEVIPGNTATQEDEADVSIRVGLQDVYRRSDLSDYAGEIDLRVIVRVTDRDNLPPPDETDGGGTFGVDMRIPGSCAPTADGDTGASCAINTTLDAAVLGVVKEGRRAVWELDQVQIRDGGPDGDVDTFPNNLFMVQGVFVP